MKPNFALTLSFDGIGLLHRVPSGWHLVGEVDLNADDLAGELAVLRRTALQLDSGGLHCKLVIPNEQIRYITLDTPGADDAARERAARAALDGATPYTLEQLRIDWSVDGARTHVAAVARETLEEAETFATEHKFGPLGFVATPPEDAFVGEPYFGSCASAEAPMERDAEAIRIVGMAHLPSTETATEEATPPAPPKPFSQPPEGAATTGKKPVADPPKPPRKAAATAKPTPAPVPAFSSRRQAEGSDADKGVDPKAMARTLVAKATPRLTFGLGNTGGKGTAAKAAGKRGTPQAAAKPQPKPGGKPAAATTHARKPSTPAKPAAPARGTGTAPEIAPPARSATSGGGAARGGDRHTTAAPARSLRTRLGAGAQGLRARLGVLARAKTALADRTRALSRGARSGATRTGRQARAGLGAAGARLAGLGRIAKRRPAPTQGGPESAAPLTGTGAVAADTKAKPRSTPQDEAEKLTIFGARRADSPGRTAMGGGTRRAGLFAALGAVLGLAGIGVWAMMSSQPEAPGTSAERTTQTTQVDPDTEDLAALTPPTEGEEQQGEDQPQAITPPPLSLDNATPAARPDPEAVPPPAEPAAEPEPRAPDAAEVAAAPPPVADAQDDPSESADPGTVAISTIPRPEEAEARYAATGIWPAAPETPESPTAGSVNDLYIASIDREIAISDAVALPAVEALAPDPRPRTQTTPALPGTRFKLDERGLVEATPEGTISPDGVMIYAGAPPARPPRLRTSDNRAQEALRERLSSVRPKARPEGLVEETERSQLGGRTRTELAVIHPRPRPDAIAAQASDEGTEDAADIAAVADDDGTALAVAVSLKPEPRPAELDAKTVTRRGDTVAPEIPTTASVAKQATVTNAIRMRDINLIGVYGKPSGRRALVRLPNGKFTKVKVGDSLDGGRVAAIGEHELRYIKRGRNLVLRMPSG